MLSITWNATTLCSCTCVSIGSIAMIATSTNIVPAAKKFPGIQDVVTYRPAGRRRPRQLRVQIVRAEDLNALFVPEVEVRQEVVAGQEQLELHLDADRLRMSIVSTDRPSRVLALISAQTAELAARRLA